MKPRIARTFAAGALLLGAACGSPFADSGFDSSVAFLLNGISATAGFTLVETNDTTAVSENAGADTYTLKLATEPLSAVTVNLSFDGTQITVNGSAGDVQLTFDANCPGSTCWNSEQTITVQAVNNTAQETSTQVVAINHTTVTGDANYTSMTAAVNVTVTDSAFTWSQTINPSGGQDVIKNIALDSDYVYAVGTDDTASNQRWRIEKRDILNGELVSAFGTGGIVVNAPSNSNDLSASIAQDTNYLYVAGYDRTNGEDGMRLEKRDKTTGALVAAFGTGGVVATNPSAQSDRWSVIAINSTHVFVAGRDSGPGNHRWVTEKRDITTGALEPAFGTGGNLTTNPTTSNDAILDLILDGTSIYLIGHSAPAADTRWRIEKRDMTTGALDTSFNATGFVTNNPSAGSDIARAAAVDSTHIYIVGDDSTPGNEQWRIEKRLKSTGALETAFNTTGVITVDFAGGGNDFARDVVVDGNRLYVAGVDNALGYQRWNVRVYNATTGALDTSFDNDGILQIVAGTSSNTFEWGLAVDSTHLYLGGSDYAVGNRQWKLERRLKSTGSFDY